MSDDAAQVRIDKWLWAARLVKTRGLAATAIKGGRVDVNGQRAKPSKDVRPGDRIELKMSQGRRMTVVVRGLSERRGPAKEAVLLYDETAESREARERYIAEARAAGLSGPRGGERPTKRDRRRLEAMRTGQRRRPE
jgi:ribosome-associated heat shock protein Hsp15